MNQAINEEKRYVTESHYLSALSTYALNKSKNYYKGDFEDVQLDTIFDLLKLEIDELHQELMVHKQKENYERIIDEIADCAAFLTGMLARLSKESESESRDK